MESRQKRIFKAETIYCFMRRIIFFISIIFILSPSTAQILKPGYYITAKKDRGFDFEFYHFSEDSSFQYIIFSCTGDGWGKGKWYMEDDSLVLAYNDLWLDPQIVDLSFGYGGGDRIDVDIEVKEYRRKRPMEGVSVTFSDDTPNPTGVFTSKEGKAIFKIEKVDFTRDFKCSYIGYQPVKIPVSPEVNTIKGTIRMARFWIYRENEIDKFNLKRANRRSLVLSKYKYSKTKFIRVSEDEYLQMLRDKAGESIWKFYEQHFLQPSN